MSKKYNAALMGVLATLVFAVPVAGAALEIARVGKTVLTAEDLKSKLGSLPPVQKQFLNRDDRAKSRLVENFITEELFVQEAEKAGLDKTSDFKEAMENQRRQLLAREFLKRNVESKLTDSAVKSYFNKNKQRYRTDEVHALHILVKTKAAADEVYEKAKKTKSDADFKALAKKFSKDPSAPQNLGDLGFFRRSQMVPEFAEAAFGMKEGQISKPVKTDFGWHVIKVVGKKKGENAKFDAVKARVKSDLRNERLQSLVASLKKERKVTRKEENIEKLKF